MIKSMAAEIVNINFKGRVIYKRCVQLPLQLTLSIAAGGEFIERPARNC